MNVPYAKLSTYAASTDEVAAGVEIFLSSSWNLAIQSSVSPLSRDRRSIGCPCEVLKHVHMKTYRYMLEEFNVILSLCNHS